MKKKRLLIVTHALDPYTVSESISKIARDLSQQLQQTGMEIRILMPRFGNINERRHRLHEVVRLSGININVNDEDYPLVIKVASLPGTRMQVYFLDNEDLFKRNGDIVDAKNKIYKDNAERMTFFCKGVMEIIKKFGWAPDIIHCHGWMTSLVPLYAKTAYKNEPVFKNSKVIYSIYDHTDFKPIKKGLEGMATINGSVSKKEISNYAGDTISSLNTAVVDFVDSVIKVNAKTLNGIDKVIKKKKVKTINHPEKEFFEIYKDLYKSLLAS